VQHISVTSSARAVYETFAVDKPDVELHELPGLCSHFVVDSDGRIYQLAPLDFLCRHTVGLNHTALGIEHVGYQDADVLRNPQQMRASLRLTRWLRCRSGIPIRHVIGHNESLQSPYHHERVPALKRQTHGDWQPASMDEYRRKLRDLAC
jgi:N-acetylmuramoyl-L-alanine amidase